MFVDVTFFESTPFFSQSPIYKSQGEEDDLLVYFVNQVSVPHHPTGLSTPMTIHPSIVHVYS